MPVDAERSESRGAAYLQQRQQERALAEQAGEVRARCVEGVHERLGASARASAANPPQRPEVHGRELAMLLNGAYLVERDRMGEFREAVRRVAGGVECFRFRDRADGTLAALQLRLRGGGGDVLNDPSPGTLAAPSRATVAPGEDVALIDLLDRLLGGGVVLAGDITLAVADIDLVYVGLRALISSVASAERAGVTLP